MVPPRYTVIVPVLRFDPAETVLASLRANQPTAGALQVIVTEGQRPSRQRNAALACAKGEIVVFLDNDSQLDVNFWPALEEALARPGVQIVGGPALLRPDATNLEKIFHALLSHPFVVGPVAARYAARGEFRATTQTELILCNLAARRGIFAQVGPLSTELYPNEENEWLDRAQAAGIGIFYDPALRVYRPQRATGWQLLRMLARYGVGRTRQWRVSGWRPSWHQAASLLVLVPLFLLLRGPWGTADLILLWLIVAQTVSLTCNEELSPLNRSLAGLLAPLLPLTYALGQIAGLFMLGHEEEEVVPPVLYDESGRRLDPTEVGQD